MKIVVLYILTLQQLPALYLCVYILLACMYIIIDCMWPGSMQDRTASPRMHVYLARVSCDHQHVVVIAATMNNTIINSISMD